MISHFRISGNPYKVQDAFEDAHREACDIMRDFAGDKSYSVSFILTLVGIETKVIHEHYGDDYVDSSFKFKLESK